MSIPTDEVWVVCRHRMSYDESKCECPEWIKDDDIDSCNCDLPEVKFFDDVIAVFESLDEAQKSADNWQQQASSSRRIVEGDTPYMDVWLSFEVHGPVAVGRMGVYA